jgi:RimJ/RimL family protein N-acetyltransferase
VISLTLPACRYTGLHIYRTRRMWVVSARRDDVLRGVSLLAEAGAQRWLGWSDDDIAAAPALPDGPVRDLRAIDDAVRPDRRQLFFIGIERRSRRVATWTALSRQEDGQYEVGIATGADFRGRGYGREALRAVCAMAHHHFGIRQLTAGCEAGNRAAAKVLAAAGFRRTDGPATHTLGNGREIDPLWWVRSARLVRHACRWTRAS